MYLWARLPVPLDPDELFTEARQAGILLAVGPMFSLSAASRNYLRFNVAYATDPALTRFLSERCERYFDPGMAAPSLG
jgi:DNA-binding transcriptional MocR family regulator